VIALDTKAPIGKMKRSAIYPPIYILRGWCQKPTPLAAT